MHSTLGSPAHEAPGVSLPAGPACIATQHAPDPPYSTLDSAGREVPGASLPHELSKDTAVRMYETMVKLQTVDTIFYEAQRQVRCCAAVSCAMQQVGHVQRGCLQPRAAAAWLLPLPSAGPAACGQHPAGYAARPGEKASSAEFNSSTSSLRRAASPST